MSRRVTTFVVALVLVAGLIAVAFFIKVPYVILQPGPVTNTLGNVPAGDTADNKTGGPVIQISGTQTLPTDGKLYLTTVEELPGSCSAHPSFWQAAKAWFDPHDTVEPQQVECPPGQTSQQTKQQAVQEMTESQSNAIIAALTELGYKSTGNRVEVGSIDSGVPAAKVLDPGDIIEAANGTTIRTVKGLQAAVRAQPAPATINLTVLRGHQTLHLTTTTFKGTAASGSPGVALIGISPVIAPSFNGIQVNIGIDPDVIGGPSAGTALALGIIDKLTPGGLTGGRTIAGTGTVSPRGKVGPIGGIQQKIAAAVAAHATVFFAPASECTDAKAAAPSSLTVVKVTTLHDAVTSLKAIKSGSNDFPHC